MVVGLRPDSLFLKRSFFLPRPRGGGSLADGRRYPDRVAGEVGVGKGKRALGGNGQSWMT